MAETAGLRRVRRWRLSTEDRWKTRCSMYWVASGPRAHTSERLSWKSWAEGQHSFASHNSSTKCSRLSTRANSLSLMHRHFTWCCLSVMLSFCWLLKHGSSKTWFAQSTEFICLVHVNVMSYGASLDNEMHCYTSAVQIVSDLTTGCFITITICTAFSARCCYSDPMECIWSVYSTWNPFDYQQWCRGWEKGQRGNCPTPKFLAVGKMSSKNTKFGDKTPILKKI